MNLAHGGHLTHGMALNFSGRLYEVHAYGVRQDTERIDYDAMATQAREVRPKLIVGGASAYPRTWDFERMAEIAADVGAMLFIDMAHVAGLVAAGVHPSPFPHADLVTTTTHKTLRGPRGGMVFGRRSLRAGLDGATFPAVKNGANEGALAASIDRNVFPGTQGGPLMQVIAGKAVAFKLAAEETFRADQRRTVENAAVMAETLAAEGARVVSGGTDNHLMLVDVTPLGVTGKEAEHLLDEIGITVNKNAIPFDTLPAEHGVGHPDRDARHDLARVRAGRDASGRPDHHRGHPTTRRAGGPRPPGRRSHGDREPVPGSGAARRVIRSRRRRVAVRVPIAMTFILRAADAVGPILVVFVAALLIALALTPLVRRIVLRYEVVDQPEARRVNTVPVPRGGGLAVCAAFLLVAVDVPVPQPGRHVRPDPGLPRCRPRSLPCCSVAPSPPASARSTTCSTFGARWQLLGQVALALFAVALGITIDFIANPLGGPAIRFVGPIAAGLTVFWIVGMINSINWIDGLDGLSTGIALIAAVTLGIISLTTQVGQPLIAVLCFALAGALLGFLRWNFNPASIFTGHERRPVRRLHAGRARHPGHRQGRGRPPRARRPDHRHLLDHRPPAVARAARRSARTGRTSTTACSTLACRIARRSSSSTASAWRSRSCRCSCRASPSCMRSSACSSRSGWSCSCRPAATSIVRTSWKPRRTSQRYGPTRSLAPVGRLGDRC